MQDPNQTINNAPQFQKQLFFQWLLVNSLAFGSWSLFISLSFTDDLLNFMPLIVAVVGLGGIGYLQFYVLRKFYPALHIEWIRTLLTAAVIGFAFYFFIFEGIMTAVNLSDILTAVLTGLYSGACLGIVQYFYLRKIFRQAHWWLIANLLVWTFILLIAKFFGMGFTFNIDFLYGLISGIIYAQITGIALTKFMHPINSQNSSTVTRTDD